MKRTVKVSIDISQDRFINLMNLSAEIFNLHIDWCYANKSYNKNKAHKALYNNIRNKFSDIPSALIQSIRDMALESIKSLSKKLWKKDKIRWYNEPRFAPRKGKTSAIRYDLRTANLRGNLLTLSCIGKRERVLVKIPKYFQEVFTTWKFTGLKLTYDKDKRKFFVHLDFEKEAPALQKGGDILGIDRGIKHIIHCSNGLYVDGKKINKIRRKRKHQQKVLTAKGTRSSQRRLKSLRGREKRFSLNETHKLANLIVELPFTIFALEDLEQMAENNQKNKKKRNKFLRKRISNWAYRQLEMILSYKAQIFGKSIFLVDGRYTSQKCHCCGYINKKNRKGDSFCCLKCGNKCHADFNASINIRDLARRMIAENSNQIPRNGQAEKVNQPIAPTLTVKPVNVVETSSGARPLSS